MFIADPALVERTRQLCADDAFSAKIRDHLLEIELDGHRHGWDSDWANPHFFQVDVHDDTSDTQWHLADEFNDTLHHVLHHNGGDLARALQFMAGHAEDVADLVRTGRPPLHWADDVPREVVDDLVRELEETVRRTGVEAVRADQDLVRPCAEDYDFLGYGLRSEMWSALIDRSTPQGQEAWQYLKERRLDEYAGRQEFRYVWFITRLGDTWVVERRRSGWPKVVHIHPEDLRPANGLALGGALLNGLSRMVNAVLADCVPIWPLEFNEPPQASKPNPLFRPNS